MLRACARDAVELGARELNLPVGHGNDFLHSSLAKSLAAKYQTALIVLNGAGKNLRGRGAGAIHENG